MARALPFQARALPFQARARLGSPGILDGDRVCPTALAGPTPPARGDACVAPCVSGLSAALLLLLLGTERGLDGLVTLDERRVRVVAQGHERVRIGVGEILLGDGSQRVAQIRPVAEADGVAIGLRHASTAAGDGGRRRGSRAGSHGGSGWGTADSREVEDRHGKATCECGVNVV